MVSPYRPSNRITATGLLFLLMAILCAGIVFGGLAFVISRLVWLIILFPVGLGLMAGAILSQIITKQHIRNPMLAIAAGIVMGIVIYGVLNYANYLAFHSELRQLLAEEQDLLDTGIQNQAIDAILAAETGSTGFFGYVKLETQAGVSIGSIGQSNALRLNQPLTWGYWLLELCLIWRCRPPGARGGEQALLRDHASSGTGAGNIWGASQKSRLSSFLHMSVAAAFGRQAPCSLKTAAPRLALKSIYSAASAIRASFDLHGAPSLGTTTTAACGLRTYWKT